MVDRVRIQQQRRKLPTPHPEQKQPVDKAQQPVNFQPHVPSPDNVLLLQRTVGNHLAREIIGQTHKPVIQRLPSYEDFQKQTGQIAKTKKSLGGKLGIGRSDYNDQMNDMRTQGQIDTYSGTAATDMIENTRAANRITPLMPGVPDTGILGMNININNAYMSYEKSRGKPDELKQLINLFDTITLWQTANAGGNLTDTTNSILEPLKQQIKAEVQQHTDKLSEGAPPARPMANPHIANFQFPANAKFLQEIGMPPQYYLDQFQGNAARMRQIAIAYEHLKSGDNERAMECINLLNKNVPGFYLIRSLLVSKFPHLAGLEDVIGTNAHTTVGSAVTPQEAAAINWYTSQAYKEINTQLRNQDLLPSNINRQGQRKFGGSKNMGRMNVQSQMELAVSGMNKMPKFTGVSYRNIINPSKDFESALSPGGAMSDMGFVSASPSMKGVGNFMSAEAGKGSMHIFFIMHTKTAVNVISLSKSPHEGEILFRPGTRFMIQNVWQHDSNGNVPRGAPVEAQMVLHSELQHKNAKGKSVSPENMKKNAALDDTDTDKYQGGYFKTKVVELIEV